ncbi:CheR family methyltransferase [Colwellia psychrerythraea]|uniref:MCP methyltransferase, CheR-type n=1 Tax=Colwellia psychrerythraea TaxID=28229 RepID=A0A099L1V5_COLPS|nr:protein-glutamate O-methyltransferase CheR [Colwellia psychrerythraea]KGJ95863.1 MCP methyltransferase, CheR-type [Colwellia psychrerythraea]
MTVKEPSKAILSELKLLSQENTTALEVDMFLDAIYKQYGYDFRHYARSSLLRRIDHCLEREKKRYISELIPCVIHDRFFFDRFLQDMSITVTSMFRDPHMFKMLREKIIPKLSTYPSINIWHVGCATGEEVYSTAIILDEAGLLNRSRIYATDYNNNSLTVAESATYPIAGIRQFSKNYQDSGGLSSFADYYHAGADSVVFSNKLRNKITFAHHNLMKDGVFAEMHLILCRNVLIYFDQTLQNQVLTTLADSLVHRGFLMLGDKESLDFSSVAQLFDKPFNKQRIYRKKLLT